MDMLPEDLPAFLLSSETKFARESNIYSSYEYLEQQWQRRG
jgi:hypothetical protein